MGENIKDRVLRLLGESWDREAKRLVALTQEADCDHDSAASWDAEANRLRMCADELRRALEAVATMQSLGVL